MPPVWWPLAEAPLVAGDVFQLRPSFPTSWLHVGSVFSPLSGREVSCCPGAVCAREGSLFQGRCALLSSGTAEGVEGNCLSSPGVRQSLTVSVPAPGCQDMQLEHISSVLPGCVHR